MIANLKIPIQNQSNIQFYFQNTNHNPIRNASW